MIYEGIDRWNNPESSLAHYKYIKKIKIGPYTRYFYSMKDLQNYYNQTRKEWNKEDYKDVNATKKDIEDAKFYKKVIDSPIGGIAEAIGMFNGATVNGKPTTRKGSSNLLGATIKDAKTVRKDINKKNSLQAAVATGRFAVNSMFGFSTRSKAKSNWKDDRYVQAVKAKDIDPVKYAKFRKLKMAKYL